MSITNSIKRIEKSVKLSLDELYALNKLREEANSDTAFAISFDITRSSLLRIITIGSGSEANVRKIRRKLSKIQSSVNS